MGERTCHALTSMFPLLLLTVLMERRVIQIAYRRTLLYRWSTIVGMCAALTGMITALVGLELQGLPTAVAVGVWVLLAVAIFALALSAVMIVLSFEAEEDVEDGMTRMPAQH